MKNKLLLFASLVYFHGIPFQSFCVSPIQHTKETVLLDIQKKFADIESIYCEFIEERHFMLLEEAILTEGVICYQQPASIRWEIVKPYESVIVNTDEQFAQLELLNGTWKPLTTGSEEIIKMILSHITSIWDGSFVEKSDGFDVSVHVEDNNVKVTMSPKLKSLRRMISSVDIHFTPDVSQATKIVIRQTSGDHTIIRFTYQTQNIAFPAGTFDYPNLMPIAKIQEKILR